MKKELVELNLYAKIFLVPNTDIQKAIDTAYGDMARHTLHIDDEGIKKKYREAGSNWIKQHISELSFLTDKSSFDAWHEKTCNELVEIYNNSLHYGQAQKWVNMVIKYLYCFNIEPVKGLCDRTPSCVEWFHAPIDSKIMDIAKNRLNLKSPCAWSTMNKKQYQNYQQELTSRLKTGDFENPDEKIPFYWEIINWNN